MNSTLTACHSTPGGSQLKIVMDLIVFGSLPLLAIACVYFGGKQYQKERAQRIASGRSIKRFKCPQCAAEYWEDEVTK